MAFPFITKAFLVFRFESNFLSFPLIVIFCPVISITSVNVISFSILIVISDLATAAFKVS